METAVTRQLGSLTRTVNSGSVNRALGLRLGLWLGLEMYLVGLANLRIIERSDYRYRTTFPPLRLLLTPLFPSTSFPSLPLEVGSP